MGKIITSIRKLLSKLLMIVAIVLFVLAALVSGGIVLIPFLGASLLPYIGLALGAIALAFVIDSKEAKKVLGRVFEVVDSVVDGISKITSNAVASVFKNNWWWILPLGALGLWYLAPKDGAVTTGDNLSLKDRRKLYREDENQEIKTEVIENDY